MKHPKLTTHEISLERTPPGVSLLARTLMTEGREAAATHFPEVGEEYLRQAALNAAVQALIATLADLPLAERATALLGASIAMGCAAHDVFNENEGLDAFVSYAGASIREGYRLAASFDPGPGKLQ